MISIEGHKVILNDFLNLIRSENITSILDAGSGKTSLSIITNAFPNTHIDAIIFPGDIRKINSIREITVQNKNISLIEKDICHDIVSKEYYAVIAHLLLGEAMKFGNKFDVLLEKVISLKYKYLIIIDYLEDPTVKENDIIEICKKYNLTILCQSYFTNQKPQAWHDFIGIHNFGYLIKRL